MKTEKRSILLKIGIFGFIVFIISLNIILYYRLIPEPINGPDSPRFISYEYETFEEMQKAENNMEYKEAEYFFNLGINGVVKWKYQIKGVDRCGSRTHSREEVCNKLHTRQFMILGSYDGGFTDQNQYFRVSFGQQPAKDITLQWDVSPKTSTLGKPNIINFHLRNEEEKLILFIEFYNISEDEIYFVVEQVEELVYQSIK